MVIKTIIIELEPSKDEKLIFPDRVNDTIIFDSTTHQWTSRKGGFLPGEIKLIAAIDEARRKQ